MITCKEFSNIEFSSKEEMFKELIANKGKIISLKKSVVKEAESFSYYFVESANEDLAYKANTPVNDDVNSLRVKVVMNTTNLMDSHSDMHVDEIWKKTLKDKPSFLHLQEHKRTFDAVISDDAKAYTRRMRWKSLGYDFEGSTQALIFESEVTRKRNEFMLNQYANGWVKNHSVGMQYVTIELAVNSEAEWSKAEKEVWDKYYPLMANKERADDQGYFWAVTEAKLLEGSAVLIGSNYATPTLDNNMKAEQSLSNNEPSIDTQKTELENFLSNLKFN